MELNFAHQNHFHQAAWLVLRRADMHRRCEPLDCDTLRLRGSNAGIHPLTGAAMYTLLLPAQI